MSNLADQYLTAGFADEADKLCQTALLIEDYHPRVVETLGRLKQKPKEEVEKEEKVIADTKPHSDFLGRFGKAATHRMPSTLPPKWIGPNGVLLISITGSEFQAVGEYELPPSGLALAVAGTQGVSATPFKVEYRGTIRGRAIDGRVTHTNMSEHVGLINRERSSPVLLFLSDDELKIGALEALMEKSPVHYEWKPA